MRHVLGIDPGTKCGWALFGVDDDGEPTRLGHGVFNLQPKRHEGGGMRFVRLRKLLRELLSGYEVELAGYELVRGHKGTDASQIYGGLVAVITEEMESRGIDYVGIPVGTIKKRATGKGNAGKPQMVAAARDRWDLAAGLTDDEADALFVGLLACEELP